MKQRLFTPKDRDGDEELVKLRDKNVIATSDRRSSAGRYLFILSDQLVVMGDVIDTAVSSISRSMDVRAD